MCVILHREWSDALEAFPDEPITTLNYVEAARPFNVCRSRGVRCGPIDRLICTIAIQSRMPVLTNDGGLLRCIDLLKFEGYLTPPPFAT